jgi:hypothetical protein
VNKLRGNILSKLVLMLVIAGVGLFNFSTYTGAFCEISLQEEESCCCSTECSSTINFSNVDTISNDCVCAVIELTNGNVSGKFLINSNHGSNSSNKTIKPFFAKTVDLNSTEIPVTESCNIFTGLPGNIFVFKDIYLFNSTLRI